MKTTTKMATSVAFAVLGMAATAASASAYSIDAISPNVDPFGYTGTGATQTFKIGASGPTVTCSSVSFAGTTHNVAGNFAATDFTPTYLGTGSGGSCNGGALGNVKITTTGKWRLTATSGSAPTYGGTVAILSGAVVTIKPLTVPTCTITVPASTNNQTLSGASGTKDATGTTISGTVSGIEYTTTGAGTCPGVAASGTDAVYNTVSGVRINGVTVNP